MESFIFLTEKKDGRIKARICTHGSSQRNYTNCNEAASSMALMELHLITAVINTKQGCNIMIANIPNAFVQMDIKQKPNSKKLQ
jgi:hypothetical protein